MPILFGCGQSAGVSEGTCKTCSSASSGSSSGGGDGSSAHAGSVADGGNGGAAVGGSAAGGQSGAGLGGAGSAPERVVAVTRLVNLIVANGVIYYSDIEDGDQQYTAGHLRGVSVLGGTPRIYAEAPQVAEGTVSTRVIWGIAADSTYVYWSEDPTLGKRHVAKTSIESGDTVDVWQDSSCQIRKPLALAGSQLYWLAGCVGVSGQLMTASTSGGSASVLAAGNDPGWQGNPSGSNAEIRGLAVGNGFAVWTQVTGSVVSLPLSGGTPLQIRTLTQVDGPSAIAVAGERAIFLQPDYEQQAQGDIWSFVPGTDFATSATSLVHIAQQQLIESETAIAVDEEFVYWGVTDSIKRAPRGGGDAVAVVVGLPHPDPKALAVDATHVYWADDTGIWRAPKTAR